MIETMSVSAESPFMQDLSANIRQRRNERRQQAEAQLTKLIAQSSKEPINYDLAAATRKIENTHSFDELKNYMDLLFKDYQPTERLSALNCVADIDLLKKLYMKTKSFRQPSKSHQQGGAYRTNLQPYTQFFNQLGLAIPVGMTIPDYDLLMKTLTQCIEQKALWQQLAPLFTADKKQSFLSWLPYDMVNAELKPRVLSFSAPVQEDHAEKDDRSVKVGVAQLRLA